MRNAFLLVAASLVGACGSSGGSGSSGGGPDASSDTTPPFDGGAADSSTAAHDSSLDVASDAPPAEAGDAGPPPFVEDTYDGIHAFLTFDYNVMDVQTAAAHDVFVWGADIEHVPAYRGSTNPGITLSSYIPWTRDPNGMHNLAYWQNLHPDWIVYRCDQTTPVLEFSDPNLTLDISNPAVIDWQAQSYGLSASEAGYDAIAADNFVLSNAFGACGVFRNGQWVQLYTGSTTDPKYTSDALAWTVAFRSKLQAFRRPLGLVPNFSLSGLPANDPNVVQLVANVDGILDEAGYTRYGSGPATGTEWQTIESFVEYVQAQGKAYFSLTPQAGMIVDRTAVQWALASYLMSKEHASALYVSGQQGYGGDNYMPEYDAAIGKPCGAMAAAQGVFTRTFQNALAIVNPTTAAVTFTLPPGTFVDLYGNSVSGSVPLAATSGLVLLTSSPGC